MIRARPVVSLVLGALLLVAATRLRSETARAFEEVVEDEDRYYLPPTGWLRAFSLGYGEAVADLVWIKTVVYFGGRMDERIRRLEGIRSAGPTEGTETYTANYVRAVVDLDPAFREAFRDGSKLTLYEGGRISRSTVEKAIEILRDGISRFPSDGELAFDLGFLCYYEIEPYLDKDKERDLRDRYRKEGARLVRRAAILDNAPPYTSLLAASLLKREGLDDLVVEHLRHMLSRETDPAIRRSLEIQLAREVGEAASRDIAETRRLQRDWRRDLPYVPFDLFLLLDQDVEAREVLDPLYRADRILGISEGPTADDAPPGPGGAAAP